MKIVRARGLQVEHQDKGLQRVYVVMPFVLALLLLWITTILRAILRSVGRGTPFTSRNASRLKLLGLLVMASGPVYGLMEYVYGSLLRGRLDVPGAVVEVSTDGHVIYVGVGLIILVLGQVFKYGVGLREDSELTI
ncbi:MAG: DUF2975 domain-containing protein [Candidatus Krumholzibacteriota bacterium]|nr:DUF2975 domain-containing protein [Candidatus Krumholzibacteriota bacterium]